MEDITRIKSNAIVEICNCPNGVNATLESANLNTFETITTTKSPAYIIITDIYTYVVGNMRENENGDVIFLNELLLRKEVTKTYRFTPRPEKTFY